MDYETRRRLFVIRQRLEREKESRAWVQANDGRHAERMRRHRGDNTCYSRMERFRMMVYNLEKKEKSERCAHDNVRDWEDERVCVDCGEVNPRVIKKKRGLDKSKMTLKELREVARRRGERGYSTMQKERLVKFLFG